MPCGKARQGKARQGKARQGKARQGKARQGKARQVGALDKWEQMGCIHTCIRCLILEYYLGLSGLSASGPPGDIGALIHNKRGIRSHIGAR